MELAPLKRQSRVLAPGSLASPLLQKERHGLMHSALLARQPTTTRVFTGKRYSLRESAMALQTNPATLRTWIVKGLIKGSRVGPRGWYWIPESEILRLQQGEAIE